MPTHPAIRSMAAWAKVPTFETPLLANGERDERALMGVTAGYMWLLAALMMLGGLVVPGSHSVHELWVVLLGLYGIAYGYGSLTDRIPWSRIAMRTHVFALLGMLPMFGLAIWATGGARSYAQLLMVLPLIFSAYFYRGRVALAMVSLLVVLLATPLAYDSHAVSAGYPGRFYAMAVLSYAVAGIVLWLKAQLVEAERRQREISLRDPLTGLANRRAFDAALGYEVGRAAEFVDASLPTPTALVFFDIDRFKLVNDIFGHPIGDCVLQQVATNCLEGVRPADTFARIGGDEFAIVAPRAGRAGALRLVEQIENAVGRVRPADGWAPVQATVGYALLGADGHTAAELMQAADGRLHAGKRASAEGDDSEIVA